MRVSLIGALTSKPYAFAARSWELKSVETIDLFDSLCSNIKIDIRGSEILRVLPTNNDFINEEWISDKTRFSYDGLKRWRFTLPLLRTSNEFKEISWKDCVTFLNEKLTHNDFRNIVISTGNHTDLETVSFLKNLSLRKKHVLVNPNLCSANTRSEFYLQSDLLFNKKNLSSILIVGTNLRLENPIVNLRLRNLSKKQNVLIGFIGSKYDYNINFCHLGNSFKTLYSFLRGKHSFCTYIKNFEKQNHQKQRFQEPTNILLGSNFFNAISGSGLIKSLSTSTFKISTLYNYSGALNALEVNAVKGNVRNIDNQNPKIFYSIGTEFTPNIKKNDLSIFQGHHNDIMRTDFDLILPSTNWTEGSYTYLNCLNIVQKTNKVISEFNYSRPDWKILKVIANTLGLTSNLNTLPEIHTIAENYSPNIWNNLNIYNVVSKYKLSLDSKSSNRVKTQMIDMPCKPFTVDFYSDTSIVRASKVMNLCKEHLQIENKLLI